MISVDYYELSVYWSARSRIPTTGIDGEVVLIDARQPEAPGDCAEMFNSAPGSQTGARVPCEGDHAGVYVDPRRVLRPPLQLSGGTGRTGAVFRRPISPRVNGRVGRWVGVRDGRIGVCGGIDSHHWIGRLRGQATSQEREEQGAHGAIHGAQAAGKLVVAVQSANRPWLECPHSTVLVLPTVLG